MLEILALLFSSPHGETLVLLQLVAHQVLLVGEVLRACRLSADVVTQPVATAVAQLPLQGQYFAFTS